MDGNMTLFRQHLGGVDFNRNNIFTIEDISISDNYIHITTKCKKCELVMNIPLYNGRYSFSKINELIIRIYSAFMMSHFFGSDSSFLCDVVKEV